MKYVNNPLNIRYSSKNRWKGQSGSCNGFACFTHLDYGVRTAAYLLMISYRKRGARTYAELIRRFAPPHENPTDSYISYVTDKVHAFPWDIPTTLFDFAKMIHAMWFFEQGEKPSYDTHKIHMLLIKFEIRPYGE